MNVNEMRAGYGHGDYLSDIGNVSQEVRHGMWTFTPHSVDDLIAENTEINETIHKEIIDSVSNIIKKRYGFKQLKPLGGGFHGVAYDVGDGKALKITIDYTEANHNYKLKQNAHNLERIAIPYEVFKVNRVDWEYDYDVFVIILEMLDVVDVYSYEKKMKELDNILYRAGEDDLVEFMSRYLQNNNKDFLNDADVRKKFQENPELSKLFFELLDIADELKSYNINTIDFLNANNLGYKSDGKLAFFDVGAGDYFEPASPKIQSLEIEEEFAGGGATKFTSVDDVSSGGFPTRNTIDNSPSIRNNLDANSALYNEELEYKQVDDATADEYVMDERKKAWIPGSQSVEVKRECQLGGKGDGTSKACNQGDINNLVLKTIKEYFNELNEYAGEKHDKYVSNKIGTSTEFGDFEKKYQKHISSLKQLPKPLKTPKYDRGKKVTDAMGKLVFDEIPIYVNPSNLGVMESNVRAVLLDSGDLYVAEKQALHHEIIMALIKNKVVDLLTPQQADDYPEKFIYLIRSGNSNTFELSNSQGNKKIDDKYIEQIFNKARKKVGNQIKFQTNVSFNENFSNFVTDEGVGDRYLARREPGRFPEDEFSEFDVEYDKQQIIADEEVVFDDHVATFPHYSEDNKVRLTIVKNPKNLSNFGANVRGVIDKEGNLFLEVQPKVIHRDLITILSYLGHINNQEYWHVNVPEEFLTVVRDGKTNKIFLGESNEFLEKSSDKFKESFIAVIKFLNKARIKNPKFTFIPEQKRLYGKRDIRKIFQDMDNNMNENILKLREQISTLQELPFKQEVENLGGKIYSVGGAVRDEFLGKESKDLDVLITGVPSNELVDILSKYGKLNLVGESFGIIKFVPEGSNEEIDIAIPRTDTPTGGGGHKDFNTQSDHTLPIEKDLYRRDFTINAMAKDIDGNIIDPYNGLEDLKNKIIRAVNPDAFSDDPLRMLRAIQFASRFGFTIEPHTFEMIQKNLDNVGRIAMERRYVELDKIREKGDMRYGAQLLKDTGFFRKLFGYELNQSIIDNAPFDKVNTTAEFIFLILQESQTPEELFKTRIHNLADDYKIIKALNIAYKSNANHPIAARSTAHNMYLKHPKSLESNILPELIKTTCNDLLQGKYPKTVNELAVNGNDLMQIGLKNKQIGDIQKKLLLKVYSDNVENNKENLLTLANEIMSNNELSEISVIDNNNNNKRREDKPIQYSGVILDESSRQRLLRAIKMMGIEIPEDWEIIAHHVTIAFAKKIPNEFERMNAHLGLNIGFTAVSVAMDDKVIAVGVDGVESLNEKPHVTIAVNRKAGAKPQMSNELTNWIPFKRPLRLTGKVEEVEFKGF
ncbi:MAG: CCA tRNA nucleotidyltransferase [bacterium]